MIAYPSHPRDEIERTCQIDIQMTALVRPQREKNRHAPDESTQIQRSRANDSGPTGRNRDPDSIH